MSDEKITKAELDLLSGAVDRIISSEVLEDIITEKLPKTDDLKDSNKVYQGKVSILFVDMRDSTKLPDKFSKKQLVKIYRSYVRTVVQAIRYSGGFVRDFMGDGVLAVFTDDENGNSEDKAVHAARYIATAIDKILNPVLDVEMKHRISCGIGIHTGDVFLSKVGMKGKEQDDDAENEFGIAWIGNSTNLACKFSSVVDCETILISSSTYSAISDIKGKQKWNKTEISVGNNILSGYIAEKYYLDMDEDVEPCFATQSNDKISITERLAEEYRIQLKDISTKAESLGKKEHELIEKEKRLNIKFDKIILQQKDIQNKENELNKEKYDFYKKILRSGHCKEEYVRAIGMEFWERNLQYAIDAGAIIGKDEHEVKQEISYAMVSIYEDLELYDKAYDFLVEQAKGYAWLNLSVVKNIVNKVRYCDRLRNALYERLAKNDLLPENRVEFEQAKNWLVFEYNK